ncbi:hypothetical protein NPIL_212671, partial [Nephila pilipes]
MSWALKESAEMAAN